MNSHPEAAELALYSTGDLGLVARARVWAHFRACSACREQVAAFSAAREQLSGTAFDMPPGLDWDALSADMRANVHLGLVAGSIAGDTESGYEKGFARSPRFALAVVAACVVFVISASWWLRPHPVKGGGSGSLAAAPLLEAGSNGLFLSGVDSGMTLLSPPSRPVTTTVSWDGGARARYIDGETGQVTLHHVYVE